MKRGMFTSKDEVFIITVIRRAHATYDTAADPDVESAVIRAAGNRKIPRKR